MPRTTSEIDELIACARQRYLAAFFATSDRAGEAEFWVGEVTRLENWRNMIQRLAAS